MDAEYILEIEALRFARGSVVGKEEKGQTNVIPKVFFFINRVLGKIV